MRDLLLIIHIAATAVWLGASVTQMVVGPQLSRQSPQVASAWMTAAMGLGRKLYPPAGLLVLLAGTGLVLVSDVYSFSDAFVVVGFVVIILAAVLGARVFTPAAGKAAEAFRAGDTTAANAAMATIVRFGVLDVVLILVAITAMVMRWGA
ncbi:MAG: hypothetical protein H0V96_12780 [Acidimicrobiia bacterium]|nr:hypothetical protein [Acidimicrobiia bacterium]